MTGRLSPSLLSAVAWCQLGMALVPADPTITAAAKLPRQNNDQFIGWVEASGTWYSEECNPGLTWYQDGEYAQCCPATLAHCNAPTACVGGSLIYPFPESSTTITIACTENFDNVAYSVCNTAFIFENFGDSNPKTDIVCGESSVNWSYYRKVPASATEVVSSEAPSAPPEISSPPTAGPSNSGVRPSTHTTTPLPSANKGSSKVWIAGAVAGPVVGIAIVAAIVFFVLRRRRRAQQTQHGVSVVSGSQAPTGVSQFGEAKPQFIQHTSYGQPSPGYNPNDPYNQQTYSTPPPVSPVPTSPAPQYTAPYSPPSQGAYAPEKQPHFQEPSHPEVAELGGASSTTAVSAAPPAHTAELSGDTTQR
ncbi:hypothetical protein BS50DRAFT_55537 [Corynespora cassiicola Philippines]|uniref:Mid2 domain-containing protein n=1 Tax=Corynespora cassiicola Philippines TaxID=1448308 RepID=A0A2T2NJ90_CORCC|nr:hypothetical protein BS50DRAFT_55537 [Corynespora cassiicola Philippines]